MKISFLLIAIFIALVPIITAQGITILPASDNVTIPEAAGPIAPPEAQPEVPVPSVEQPSSPALPTPEQPSLLQTFLTLITDKVEILRGELLQIKAILTDEQQTPLAEKEISFYANDEEIGREFTNEQGEAMIFWDTTPFSPGSYRIKAAYAGDSTHAQDSIASSVMVKEAQNQITAQVVAEPAAVQEVENCADIIVREPHTVMETCTTQVTKMICSDEPMNQSCNNEIRMVEYTCNPRLEIRERTERACRTTAIVVNNVVRINIDDYVCSTTEAEVITVLCDSRLDGNGDGECSSGESCMRFTIDGSTITKEEKNSRDDFVAEDEDYFLDEATVEDVQ